MAARRSKQPAGRAHGLAAILTAVEKWYRGHARALPWRIGPARLDHGERNDPYHVWLSEIMLQQTTVPHAAPYFQRFVEQWPSVDALAAASWEEVSAAWAGLGYYSRARNLHACAKAVAARRGFPQTRDGLLELLGVGPYTAAAIAAITFGEKVAPVDGNIERVVSRLFAIGSDRTAAGWRRSKAEIAGRAQQMFGALNPGQRPGDLAQGLMDLGSGLCIARRPACTACPLFGMCAARRTGKPEDFPMKPEKKARPVRFGAAFVAVRGGKVLLVRRPASGLLGGMLMPPISGWSEKPADTLPEAPAKLDWAYIGEVRHVFTHFALKLEVWRADAPARARLLGEWLDHEAALSALPTVGRKAVKLGLDAAHASAVTPGRGRKAKS